MKASSPGQSLFERNLGGRGEWLIIGETSQSLEDRRRETWKKLTLGSLLQIQSIFGRVEHRLSPKESVAI